MEIVFHTGKESEQPMRRFAEKRAEFLSRETAEIKCRGIKGAAFHVKRG